MADESKSSEQESNFKKQEAKDQQQLNDKNINAATAQGENDGSATGFSFSNAYGLSHSVQNVISEENFKLPDMGDFYLGAVDDTYLRLIDEKVNEKLQGEGNSKNAAFYTENPPYEQLGYDKEHDVYFLQSDMQISDEAIELGLTNGGQIQVDIDTVSSSNDDTTDALDLLKKKLNGKQNFLIHFAGVSVPATPKWAVEYNVDEDKLPFKTMTQAQASAYSDYIYVPEVEGDGDNTKFNFVKIAGKWRQCVFLGTETKKDDSGKEKKYATFRWLMSAGDDNYVWNPTGGADGKGEAENNGYALRDAKRLQEIINHYGTFYFVLDGCGMDPASQNHPSSLPEYQTNFAYQNQMNDVSDTDDDNQKQHTGAELANEENTCRFDGTVYVKEGSRYINVAKLMASEDGSGITSDDSYEGPNKSILKPDSYDKDDRVYADAFFETMSELDDRPDIVKATMGKEWEGLHKWTVTLGDVTFFVPPTSISSTVIAKEDRLPLIRANGSMAKTSPRTVKTLTMEVYFNEDRGINGETYETKAPNGKKLVYNVNGLRDVIAQFKFVPFVPITNDYINLTLGISAVTVTGLSISSVENYPRLMHCIISMTEFAWQVYMPALSTAYMPYDSDDEETDEEAADAGKQETDKDTKETAASASGNSITRKKDFINYFGMAFNWKTLRYYYQRAIRRGNYLRNKNLAPNSEAFVKATAGEYTSLLPMKFIDPTIQFYTANQEYMQKILKAKLGAMYGKGDVTAIGFDENQKKALKALSGIAQEVKKIASDPEFTKGLYPGSKLKDNKNHTWVASETGKDTFSFEGVKQAAYQDLVYGQKSKKKDRRGMLYISNFRGLSVKTDGEFFDQGDFFNSDDVQRPLNDSFNYLNTSIYDYCQENQNGALDLNGASIESDGTSVDSNTRKYTFTLEYPLDADLMTDQELAAFKSNVSNFTGAEGDATLKDGKLHIPISINMHYDSWGNWIADENEPFTIDSDNADIKLLMKAGEIYDKYKDQDYKPESVVDEKKLQNLQFDLYDCGTVRIKQYNATFANRISEVYTLGADGSAPQYLGGEDTQFTIVVETTNKKTASMLLNLPRVIARMEREYHAVIPCCPLRISSEISDFLGVFEVTVRNSTLETSNERTGVYVIKMDLLSVNRTLRNKEVAAKYELNNGGETTFASDYKKVAESEWTERDVWQTNTDHRSGSGVIDKRKFANYFGMRKILGQMELYPDLELPTIEEMEKAGWYFTRYKFQDDRVYVDPDFYIVYISTLTSQYYREIALKGISRGKFAEMKYVDSTGAEMTLKPAFGKGFDDTNKNEMAMKQAKILKDTLAACNNLEQKNRQENLAVNSSNKGNRGKADVLTFLNENGNRDAWSVGKAISTLFLEDHYLKEYKSYNARMAAKDAGITDPTNGASDVSGGSNSDQVTGNSNNVYLDDGTKVDDDVAAKVLGDTTGKYTSTEIQNVKAYVAQKTTTDKEQQIKDGNGSPDDVVTEGKFVYEALANARSASLKIQEYLVGNSIEDKRKDEKKKTQNTSKNPPKERAKRKQTQWKKKMAIKASPRTFENEASKFLQDSKIQEIFELLDIKISNEKFAKLFAQITYAAACAATGKKEFSGDKDATEWRPLNEYLGIMVGGSQDTSGVDSVSTKDDVKKKSVSFGCYNIKMYSASDIIGLTGDPDAAPSHDGFTEGSVNKDHYLLDPYYRKPDTSEAAIESYKVNCAYDASYCTHAFLRLMLYWLKQLIDRQAIPTITTDVLRKAATLQLRIQNTEAAKGVPENQTVAAEDKYGNTTSVESLQSYTNFFNRRTYAVDAGKIWAAEVLAVSGGDQTVLQRIDDRDYDALNAYVESCSNPVSSVQNNSSGAMAIRKMALALVGLGAIDEISALGITPTLPAMQYDLDRSEKKYLAAAEDPETYLVHSWHDMVVNDARGRLLRAFPTFYMAFIDEGREIGQWKLHDNFYSSSAIMEMDIVKSRRLPADTATITMSNFYDSYTTESDDFKTQGPSISFSETVSSIFSPSEYFKNEEIRRLNKPPEPKLRLRPGARIHIRLGYGSNANMLPIVFNGVIAEVSAEATVEITAQGDGIELTSPITYDGIFDEEAKNLPNKDDFWPGSYEDNKTPLQIATGLFNTHGGWLQTQARETFKIALFPRNPFGIVHFGDPDFTSICRNGETTQNLYESMNRPVWAGNNNLQTRNYALNEQDSQKLQINFSLYKKTPWDVLNICKSTSPDFKLAVLPFGFRSTVFMGHDRYYYAYDYVKDEHGTILEKRKPFRQFHIYTSAEDIIGDGITATNRDMKTAALGMYRIESAGTHERQTTVGPLYADFDIYPEAQRTMVVDTNLVGSASNLASGITGFNDATDGIAFRGAEGEYHSHEAVAWRMTASALRESMEDMYAGDLVILGDPSVKPQDQFFMSDKFSHLEGNAGVKEVVHHLSADTGFTTTISPDCITMVDDPFKYTENQYLLTAGGTCASISHTLEHLAVLGMVDGIIAFGGIRMGAIRAATGIGKNMASMTKKGAKGLKKLATDTDWNAKHLSAIKHRYYWAKKIVQVKHAGRAAKDAITLARAGMILSKAAGLLGFATGTGGIGLVVTIVGMIASPVINSIVANELKNMKVCHIFPLKKMGIVYTAGVEGSKGMVFGSPSFNDRGIIGDVLADVTDNWLGDIIGNLYFSDEVAGYINKMKRDNNIVNSSGKPTQNVSFYADMLQFAYADEIKIDKNAVASQQIGKQASYANPSDVLNAYNEYKVMDTEKFVSDQKFLGNNTIISEDQRIKPYIDEQFFAVLHEVPALNAGQNVEEITINKGGQDKRLKAIHSTDDNGNEVIDLPMLNPNAVNVLYELIRRAKNKMPAANATDKNENYEATKTTYIVLKSGIRIGDQTTQAAAGFTFVLQATDANAQKALKAAINELHDDTNEDADLFPDLDLNGDVFHFREDSATHEVAIVVPFPFENRTEEPADGGEGAKSSGLNSDFDQWADKEDAKASAQSSDDIDAQLDNMDVSDDDVALAKEETKDKNQDKTK